MLRRSLHTLYGLYAALAFAVVILPVCLLIIVTPTLTLRRAIGRAGVRLAMLSNTCRRALPSVSPTTPATSTAWC